MLFNPKMAAELLFVRGTGSSTVSWEQACTRNNKYKSQTHLRASHSTDKQNKVYKQLGLFSLKRKIEDAVLRAEMLAPPALELEEARRIKQEEMIHDHDLWDDPAKSNEILIKLADSEKVVDALKDLQYKAEEAKLISQLAEMDAINYGLFRQAYDASLDVSKLLDQYEMSKLLHGPYDIEGACVTIKAGSEGVCPELNVLLYSAYFLVTMEIGSLVITPSSTYLMHMGSAFTEHDSPIWFHEIWAEQLLSMYIKWAEKQGYKGRLVETCCSVNGGIKSATIEFEFEYAFGYLSGETGVHLLITSKNHHEASPACVDVVPLFLETASDLQISDEDLVFSPPLMLGEAQSIAGPAVCIQHIPTGISVQSSGERNRFTNKMKALNRLKAKLLVLAREQLVSSVSCIKRDAIVDVWQKETRRYISHPYKLVQDVKTGIQLPDLNSVLDGNIETIIGAYINMRESRDRD
ncbi:hypothetical protein EZV62_005224 [Acer yangbiense]|uniref:Peptide chain release factor domain-containing protein n=1 Tax=Acer yangbiense TaxID=1000413 RepID=A0A5C7IMJ5_9ROSI|nr:hypothetical protein EZV62_005224 [Acer yangbiense]